MNGYTLFGKELKQIIRQPKILIPLIAVILAPILYAGMFLWAFKDPYAKMDQLPVAVVNQDQGAKMDGQQLTLGKDLVSNLKKSDGFDFHFVSEQRAMDGLRGRQYYMVIKIPENFSKSATTLLDKNPEKLQLQYMPNDSYNFLSSQIGETAMLKVKEKMADEISKTYAESVFQTAEKMAGGFKTASTGAAKLNQGAVKLDNGVKVLKQGTGRLLFGAASLQDGSTKVYNGALAVNSGAAALNKGMPVLQAGIVKAGDGAQKLNAGAGRLYAGAVSLNNGTAQANTGAKALKANLEKLASGSITFTKGISDAASGAEKLASGTSTLRTGLNQLSTTGSRSLLAGALDLQKGAGELESGSSKLTSKLKEAETTIPAQLVQGTSNLNAGITQMKTELPGKVAKGVSAELNNGVGQIGSGLTAAQSQISSTMAAQIADSLTEEQIKQTDELVETMGKQANLPDAQIKQMKKAAENRIQTGKQDVQAKLQAQINAGLSDPFNRIKQNAEAAVPSEEAIAASISKQTDPAFGQLSAGISELNANIENDKDPHTVKSSLHQLYAGAVDLNNGIAALNAGEQTYTAGLQNQFIPNLQKANDGAVGLQTGAERLASGLKQINSGAGTLAAGAGKLADGSAALAEGTNKLQSGSSQLVNGSFALKNGTGSLVSGTNELQSGSARLTAGAEKLANGTGQLASGTGQLASGSGQLASGIKELNSGSGRLSDGTKQLKNGTAELKNKLGDAAKTASKIQANNKTYNMMADPVSLHTTHYDRVPNYGTGFTPYFLSLGLFIGALILTIVYPLVESAGIPKNGISWFFSKLGVLLIVSILQSVIADVIILSGVGIHVKNVPLFLLFSVLTSFTFMALIQFLVTFLQNPGRFLAIVILILQLTSSAGTFPLEVIPKFIQWFNPLLPMTYSVRGFKAVVSSGEMGVMWQNAGILLIYIVGAEVLTLLYFVIRYRRQYGQLHEHTVPEEV
ncbi:YhgE/Pip domain-containing protein [Heyndrickxia coagulans]|uniref:YhgE/Pip domain-containing protein n=1 Tax=Heyndrickxia coagulans TaxID=1398 RepID=UPI0028FAD086|nr:YhgE/Pip domain-containing protein [Heyndrickxia coagulans]MDT9756844.1 YhgE/Pip domain-containing protein [Heyndrickxia coagulans]